MGASLAVSTAAASKVAPEPGSLLTAMSKSGAASLVSGLLAAGANKMMASVAGPASVALLATLQQARQAALVAATANGQTALVQGASSLTGVRRREYLRTAILSVAALTLVVAVLLGTTRFPVTGFDFGPGFDPNLLRWLAVPLLLSSLYVVLSALLGALGSTGALAAIQVAASAAMLAGAPWAARMARANRPWALVALLAFSAGVSVAGAVWALRRSGAVLKEWLLGAGCLFSASAARHFFSIATTMLLSGFAGSAALLLVRSQIIRTSGLAATGEWDAAWNVSMNQAALVLASLQTHFLPAMAGARSKEERKSRFSTVLRAGVLVSALVISGLALAKPWVLTLLYAPSFRPAAEFLRWTLVGDYLKVSSWIVSIPLLAAAEMRSFLVADLVAYLTFVIAAFALTAKLGAAVAASVAFVLMYTAHLALCSALLWNRQGLWPSRTALLAWVAGLAAVVLASAVSWNWK